MPQWCGSFFSTKKTSIQIHINLNRCYLFNNKTRTCVEGGNLHLPNFNLKNLFQPGQNQGW